MKFAESKPASVGALNRGGEATLPIGLIELINLKIIRKDFAVVSVRLSSVHLRNLGVVRRSNGKIVLRPPTILSRNGESDFGMAYALQPGAREAVEAAIATLWKRVEADIDK